MTIVRPATYASPIDASRYGEHRRRADPASAERFGARIGSVAHPAEPDRYHLYAGWFCPWSQRATIQIALNGLNNVVSVSYVDGLRDGRGWAFRERTGPDHANGFTLLREAYETSEPGYSGAVSLPVLWDCRAGRIVSSDPDTIDIDLATQFRAWAAPEADTYPVAHRPAIDRVNRRIDATVNRRLGRAVYDPATAGRLLAAFRGLNTRLATRCYLVADTVTIADIRLWVSLIRYDAGPNAHGAVGTKLSAYRHLWRYARDLYSHAAFRGTTDFRAFTAPFADVPDWLGVAS